MAESAIQGGIPVSETDRAAADIRKILNPEPVEDSPTEVEETEETPVDEPQEEEADTEEVEAGADDTEDDAEPEEIPVIDAPVGWSEADREEFASLPPAVQQKIATREREREQLLSQSNREAQDRKREYESHLGQIETERQTYETQLVPMMEQMATVVLESEAGLRQLLEEGDTEGYLRAELEQRERKRQLDTAIAAHQQMQETRKQSLAQQHEQFKREQAKVLLDYFPDWKDPEKARAAWSRISDYTASEGFTQEEISNVTDARLYRVIDKARRWDDLQKSKPATKNKVAAKPKVVKPGTPRPKTDRETESYRRSLGNLRKNPRSNDAAAEVIRGLLK